MRITKGTIVRAIMLLLVVVNLILDKFGISIINADESAVAVFVEMAIEISVILVSFWKNNSFSENAIRADEFLKELKKYEKI